MLIEVDPFPANGKASLPLPGNFFYDYVLVEYKDSSSLVEANGKFKRSFCSTRIDPIFASIWGSS